MLRICKSGKLKNPKKFSHLFSSPLEAEKLFEEKNNIKITEFINKEYETILETKGLEFAYRWTSFIFSGFTPSEFKEISLNVWREGIAKREIYPYPAMLQMIKFLKQNHWKVYIVTASPSFAIEIISREFNISSDNVIGMNLELDDEIHMTPKIIEPYTYGEGKVEAFLKKTGKLPDLSFGDTINDFPLLQKSEKAVLIDRNKYPDLVEKCKNSGILIQPVFS